MKLLTDTWRQLVQRRLWPVALLLLGALAAVPFVLAKSPEPAPVASAPAAPAGGVKANAASADPIVSMVSADDSASTRRSLGMRHNPFASSAPKHKVKKPKSSTASKPKDTTPSDDAPATTGGGGTSVPTTPTTPTAPAQPTTTVPAGSVALRWGASDGSDLPLLRLGRGEALPDDAGIVFTGLKDNGKTAVFMLSEGLKAEGDGTCVPKTTCETIELKVGETEFFEYEGDVDATQFELDLAKIYKHAEKVPATGEESSTGFDTGSFSTSGGATTASLKRR
jgi:hypothetical protein